MCPIFHELRERGILQLVPIEGILLPADPEDDDLCACFCLSVQTLGLMTICLPLGAALLAERDVPFRPNPAYVCCGMPLDLLSAPVCLLVRLFSLLGGCDAQQPQTQAPPPSTALATVTAPPQPEVITHASS